MSDRQKGDLEWDRLWGHFGFSLKSTDRPVLFLEGFDLKYLLLLNFV